jgi:hypothetical protein
MKRLLEVQKEIGTLSKNAKNPFFKSQYLDLTTILQHVTPILNAQGLVLLQPLDENKVITSILDSETGDAIAHSSLTLSPMVDPQKMASQITYFRRYTLKSLLAISEEDDDGNKASKPTPIKKVELVLNSEQWDSALDYLKKGGNITDIEKKYSISDANREELMNNAI